MKYEHYGRNRLTRRHYCARITAYWLSFMLLVVLIPVPGYSQDEQEAVAPQSADSPDPVDPALRNLLALMPTATEVKISTGDSEFTALLEQSRSGTAQGTLILVPGNGQRPDIGSPTTQLQQLLPDKSWQTLTLSLHPWPGNDHWFLYEQSGTPRPEAETNAESTQENEETGAAVMSVPKTPEQWQKNNIARLAAAVTFLRANGNDDIFIAGDGLGALLVNAYLVDTPGSGIKGAILIAPRRPHTAKPTATTALDVPLLDLLPARTHITEARQRRLTLSAGAGYQQLRLSIASRPLVYSDSLLSRRIRGWMKSLSG